jgi:hypothetical protein
MTRHRKIRKTTMIMRRRRRVNEKRRGVLKRRMEWNTLGVKGSF